MDDNKNKCYLKELMSFSVKFNGRNFDSRGTEAFFF